MSDLVLVSTTNIYHEIFYRRQPYVHLQIHPNTLISLVNWHCTFRTLQAIKRHKLHELSKVTGENLQNVKNKHCKARRPIRNVQPVVT